MRYTGNYARTSGSIAAVNSDLDVCKMCNLSAGEDCIGCDTCQDRYCPNSVYVGLATNVIASTNVIALREITFSQR